MESFSTAFLFVMIYHKSILADLLTPVSAFLRVSRGAERAFLLESVEGGEKMGRYSFIGIVIPRRIPEIDVRRGITSPEQLTTRSASL